MLLHNLIADVQSESHSASRLRGSKKGFENLGKVLLGNTDAGILEKDLHDGRLIPSFLFSEAAGHRQRPAMCHRLDRVGYQIRKGLDEVSRVSRYQRESVRQLHLKAGV